ncbi:hypothetical protein Q31b_21150 [Novipirellula aureliae]|uniref:Uncharacterized protein n=1 Tax=Novipirellula aureliae TaxID=2527966 RepID=A0A5C6E2J0_9BACT|nr:hypothetical protein [Novipirellula aureliae]TWU43078.1 hypothetical protein Q31b_21150 [Novipirellula aureliae]
MNNDRLTWPIRRLLLTVLVPSVGVVWMMREVVQNERLASDQRLMDAYQTQLESAVESANDFIRGRSRQAQVRCLLALERLDLAISTLQSRSCKPSGDNHSYATGTGGHLQRL